MVSRCHKVGGILSSNTDAADLTDGLPNGKKSEENRIQNLPKEIDEMRESGTGGEICFFLYVKGLRSNVKGELLIPLSYTQISRSWNYWFERATSNRDMTACRFLEMA